MQLGGLRKRSELFQRRGPRRSSGRKHNYLRAFCRPRNRICNINFRVVAVRKKLHKFGFSVPRVTRIARGVSSYATVCLSVRPSRLLAGKQKGVENLKICVIFSRPYFSNGRAVVMVVVSVSLYQVYCG